MSNRLVIVAAGRVGSDLISHLAGGYEITCIDLNAESFKHFQSLPETRNVSFIEGDATSRLVLEKARVEEADVVLLTSTSEAVNLEVARILREKFSVPRIISIGISTEGITELESLDVEVANIFKASAHNILNIVRSEIRTPQGIGTGQGEILELTVHSRSRLANKTLSRIAPVSWRIGLVYRNDQILVPDGATRLMANDRVIVIGDPSVLKTVSELLTFSSHEFPLEYGPLALVYLDGTEKEAYFSEVDYLLNTFPLKETVFMLSPRIKDPKQFDAFFARCPHIHTVHSTTEKNPIAAILESAEYLRRKCGLIIGDKAVLIGKSELLSYRKNMVRLIAQGLENLYAPILFCAGTFPYKRVAMPAIPPSDIKPVLETALEITEQMAAELAVLLSPPSEYTGSDQDTAAFEKIKKTISDMGLLYKRKIPATTLAGNPVIEVTRALPDFNLLVLEPKEWDHWGLFSSFFSPDPILHILARSPITTLIQPREPVRKSTPPSAGKPS